ncbi:MAG: L,D-transpeptidase [Rhizomicrobium sp.]
MPNLREFAVVASIAMLAMTAAIIAQDGLNAPTLGVSPVDAARADVLQANPGIVSAPLHLRVRTAVSAQQMAEQNPVQSDDIAARIQNLVPEELFGYFDLYLYVSKSAAGPWAQHMYLFHKSAEHALVFEQAFPVSTGRERQETYFTATPEGLFELDPDRFDRVHFSRRWHNAPMPWAMFLNYTIRARPTGVALHSAEGHVSDLGHRASGGCVRLPPEKAEELFERIQSTEAGTVPEFAMDQTGATTDKTGRIARAADGSEIFRPGYRVLLIIEDYPGAPVVVATIS